MGQNTSRLRRSPQNEVATQQQTAITNAAINNAAAGASTDDTHSDNTATPVENGTTASQRSSVRRSILNVLKPRSRVGSTAANPENHRKSWRRWSKAPPLDFNPRLPASSLSATDLSSSSATAGPSTPRSDNGKQPEQPEADDESQEERGWPDDSAEAPSGSRPVAAGEEGVNAEEEEEQEEEQVAIVPEEVESLHEPEVPSTTAETTMTNDPPLPPPIVAPTTPAQQPNTPAARQQFPPPGTLVVVQGIVHTTDVARTPTQSQPAENNTNLAPPPTTNTERSSSRTRNRLSTLLRPSTAPSDSPTPSTPESGTSVDTALTTPDMNEPAADSSSVSPPQPSTTDPEADRGPTISSSSIDVLGTLLSVAAAATAASLLTGSSEPILSSGLAPPGTAPPTNANTNANNTNNTSPSLSSRPTSPTPDAALGLGIGHDTRAERMRQAWGTIRERLGLRPTPPPSTTTTTTNTPAPSTFGAGDAPLPPPAAAVAEPQQPPTTAVPTDTRELMLAEMARAFNVGLGLNGLGGVVPGGDANNNAGANGSGGGNEGGEGGVGEAQDLPAEGSFERFLFDLQADLRTALTGGSGGDVRAADDDDDDDRGREEEEEEGDGEDGDRAEGGGEHEMPPLINVSSESLESVVWTTASGSGALSGERDDTPLPGARSGPHPASMSGTSIRLTSDTPLHQDDDDDEMPALQAVSDSESESDEEESDEEGDVNRRTQNLVPSSTSSPNAERPAQSINPTTNADQPPPTTTTTTTSPSMGSGRIDAEGRINWWRLYRFPPIVSPRAAGVAVGHTGGSGSNIDAQASMGTTSADPAINSNNTETGTLSTLESNQQPSNTNNNTNIVVPVIVVGLQSVRPLAGGDYDGNEVGFHDGHGHGHGHRHGHGAHGEHTHTANTQRGVDTSEPPPSFASGSSETESVTDEDFDGFGNRDDERPHHHHHHHRASQTNATAGAGASRENRRSRGWQSRAAAAIRNLRPGNTRRNSSIGGAGGGGGNGEGQHVVIGGPGSRTFLIYVIGGYYPPDHSIVTGGPDNMESFEALLELADLLGQTKPPTASKEDIDNSGLEIIRPDQLVAREKEGRVASNCIERCLICLDEYDTEDDIRVMTCRHAFHKSCVDKWLQTGRNNCPACRTPGVSTDGSSPIHTPLTPGA